MILALASTKGGTGKSTVAIELSLIAHERGLRVALVDGDPQGSASAWARHVQPPIEVLPLPPSPMALVDLARRYDLVVVDTAGAIISEVTLVIAAADAVVMPVGPSPLDLWAQQPLIAAAARAETPIAAVIARAPVGTMLTRQAAGAAASLGVDVADTRIAQRVGHVAAILDGRIPSGIAGEEVRALYGELSAVGWVPAGDRGEGG